MAFRGLLTDDDDDDDGGEHSTCTSTVLTWDQVDFSSSSSSSSTTTDVSGKKIAIVGGGCTAVLLAINAIDRRHHQGKKEDGASSTPPNPTHVTLIVRGQLRQAWQDIDVGWWGPKYLNGYKQQSPYHRMLACRRARQHAVISPSQWNRLVELSLAGWITVLEECEVQRCSSGGSKRDNGTGIGTGTGTGSVVLDIICSNPNNETNATATQFASSVLNSTTATATATTPVIPQSIEVDTVWLACGSAYNASLDPLLVSLSCTIIGGYPVVDDTTLALCPPPTSGGDGKSSSARVPTVFILGRGAQVALGPAARDLAGWRLGGSNIVEALKTLEYYATGSESGGDNYCDSKEEEERLPLEEEGCRFDQGSKRRPVACPPHLVNISDISNDTSIPKYEIQKYAFVDEGFKIKVYIDLDKHQNSTTSSITAASTKVRSVLTERSIDVWALVEEEKEKEGGGGGVVIIAAYHLFIPMLYGRIIPGKSKVSVSSSSGNVRMSLQKIADGEWRFLKG